VLVGVDAKSTYCYLLAAAEHRDEDTGECIYWMLRARFIPDYTIADAERTQSWASSSLANTPVMEIFFHPASRQRIG